MNRAERRRQDKVLRKANKPNIDLNKLKQEITDEVMTLLLSIPLKVGYRKGWDEQQLTEFAEDITEEYQLFCDGERTLEQYKQDVSDLIGWRFEKGE